MKINNNLLSQILDIPLENIQFIDKVDDLFIYNRNYISELRSWHKNAGAINIYELAHKCKEWAWNEYSVRIESGRMYGFNTEVWNAVISVYNGHIFYIEDSEHWEESNNEPEAIFKACQYILDART